MGVTAPWGGPNRIATGRAAKGSALVLRSCATCTASARVAAPPAAWPSTTASADRLSVLAGRRTLRSTTLIPPGRRMEGARRRTSIMRATWSPGVSPGSGAAWALASASGLCAVGRTASTTNGPETRVTPSSTSGRSTSTSSASGSLLAMDLRVTCGTMPPTSSPLRFWRRA